MWPPVTTMQAAARRTRPHHRHHRAPGSPSLARHPGPRAKHPIDRTSVGGVGLHALLARLTVPCGAVLRPPKAPFQQLETVMEQPTTHGQQHAHAAPSAGAPMHANKPDPRSRDHSGGPSKPPIPGRGAGRSSARGHASFSSGSSHARGGGSMAKPPSQTPAWQRRGPRSSLSSMASAASFRTIESDGLATARSTMSAMSSLSSMSAHDHAMLTFRDVGTANEPPHATDAARNDPDKLVCVPDDNVLRAVRRVTRYLRWLSG